MSNSRSLPEAERRQRRRARALKKQAQKRTKRRENILAGLNDPFVASVLESYGHNVGVEDRVPLRLVPTRQLRQRVAELNLGTKTLYAQPSAELNFADELASPEPPITADLPEPAIAPRSPRRSGRHPAPATYPLLPFMPDQQQTLEYLLRCAEPGAIQTGIGRRHRCPCCLRNSTVADPPLNLSVHPTAAGDLVFRCRRCGWSLDSVEFFQRTESIYNLATAAAHLADCHYLSAPLPAAQLAGYERLAHLRNVFEEGRQRIKDGLPAGVRRPVPFGTWALLSTARVQRLLPTYRNARPALVFQSAPP